MLTKTAKVEESKEEEEEEDSDDDEEYDDESSDDEEDGAPKPSISVAVCGKECELNTMWWLLARVVERLDKNIKDFPGLGLVYLLHRDDFSRTNLVCMRAENNVLRD